VEVELVETEDFFSIALIKSIEEIGIGIGKGNGTITGYGTNTVTGGPFKPKGFKFRGGCIWFWGICPFEECCRRGPGPCGGRNGGRGKKLGGGGKNRLCWNCGIWGFCLLLDCNCAAIFDLRSGRFGIPDVNLVVFDLLTLLLLLFWLWLELVPILFMEIRDETLRFLRLLLGDLLTGDWSISLDMSLTDGVTDINGFFNTSDNAWEMVAEVVVSNICDVVDFGTGWGIIEMDGGEGESRELSVAGDGERLLQFFNHRSGVIKLSSTKSK
jgi:hypothetical protein